MNFLNFRHISSGAAGSTVAKPILFPQDTIIRAFVLSMNSYPASLGGVTQGLWAVEFGWSQTGRCAAIAGISDDQQTIGCISGGWAITATTTTVADDSRSEYFDLDQGFDVVRGATLYLVSYSNTANCVLNSDLVLFF